MNRLNRKEPPLFRRVEHINITKAKKRHLTNGIPVFCIEAGSQEVVKIEFLFDAGSWYQTAPLIASTTNSMLTEGTASRNSAQIAEFFDYYGAFIKPGIERHAATLTLFTLNKYLHKTLEPVADMLKNSIFPQHELDIDIQKRKRKFIVDSNKVENIARNLFFRNLFSAHHPYGQIAGLEDFDRLKREKLIGFYRRFYHSGNCKIIVSGKIPGYLIQLLDDFFGGSDWQKDFNSDNRNNTEGTMVSPLIKRHFYYKEDAVQSALRMGKLSINRLHPDYNGLLVVNEILGGYFGSRLMTSLRERRGYTYNIGSAMVTLSKAGFFVVITQVGTGVCRKAVNEIYTEIEKLCNEPVGDNELNLVKNYMLGQQLRMFDGAFALSEAFRAILDYGLDYDYFENLIETIKTITPDKIIELANKYLHHAQLLEVIAGSCA